jgi:hypothetical protein
MEGKGYQLVPDQSADDEPADRAPSGEDGSAGDAG